MQQFYYFTVIWFNVKWIFIGSVLLLLFNLWDEFSSLTWCWCLDQVSAKSPEEFHTFFQLLQLSLKMFKNQCLKTLILPPNLGVFTELWEVVYVQYLHIA